MLSTIGLNQPTNQSPRGFLNRSLYALAILGCFALAISPSPCLADYEEYPADKPLPFGYVRSIEAMTNSGYATADSMELASEYAAMNHNTDQALSLARRAAKLDDDDLDVHKQLAKALQAKLKEQKDPDPKMFNECVHEWLIVLRGERGPDRGLTKKDGRGLAWINKLYEDEDYSMEAANQLKIMVGRVPKANESDVQFITKVGKPADLTVTGKILPSSSSKESGKSGDGTGGKDSNSNGGNANSDSVLWMK